MTGIIVTSVLTALAALVGVGWLAGGLIWGAATKEPRREEKYPQLPTGFSGPRMVNCPYDLAAVGELLNIFVYECSLLYGQLPSTIRRGLVPINVTWVGPSPEGFFITDEWGRRIQGDLRGDVARVVVTGQVQGSAFTYELLRATKRFLGHRDWDIPNVEENRWPEGEWELLGRIRERMSEV